MKNAICKSLDSDIYTVTRTRLPLLLRLDELLSGGSAVYNHQIVSVEHVLPQNPSTGSQWLTDFPAESDREQRVHKLANLVLLTRRKNAQASNLDFQDKKSKYFMTKAGVVNFALTSMVLSESVWTLETLKRRQAELIAAIEKLWRLTSQNQRDAKRDDTSSDDTYVDDSKVDQKQPPIRLDRFTWQPGDFEILTPAKPLK